MNEDHENAPADVSPSAAGEQAEARRLAVRKLLVLAAAAPMAALLFRSGSAAAS